MAKVQQISEITPSFAFTEYDFFKDYEESFKKSELGRIHSILPLREMAVRFGLTDSHPHKKAVRKSYFSPEGKVALTYCHHIQFNAGTTMSRQYRNHIKIYKTQNKRLTGATSNGITSSTDIKFFELNDIP